MNAAQLAGSFRKLDLLLRFVPRFVVDCLSLRREPLFFFAQILALLLKPFFVALDRSLEVLDALAETFAQFTHLLAAE